MTLTEQIEQAQKQAEALLSENPQMTNIWFEFKDIPVSEIEARVKEVGRDYDVVNRDGKDVLRLQCHGLHDYRLTMFAYSKPVKLVKPEFVTEA